jgi:hypothetical protein
MLELANPAADRVGRYADIARKEKAAIWRYKGG